MNADLLGLFVFGSTLDLHVNLNCVHITYEYMAWEGLKNNFLVEQKILIKYNASPICLHILSLPLLVYDLYQISTY